MFNYSTLSKQEWQKSHNMGNLPLYTRTNGLFGKSAKIEVSKPDFRTT